MIGRPVDAGMIGLEFINFSGVGGKSAEKNSKNRGEFREEFFHKKLLVEILLNENELEDGVANPVLLGLVISFLYR